MTETAGGLALSAPPGRGRRALQSVARPGKRIVVSGWRRGLQARAADVTATAAAGRCLVLAPHPDDETLGCGALIARKRAAGTDVRVLVATDGRFSHRSAVISTDELARIRAAEFIEACQQLGVPGDQARQLSFEENSLGTHLDDVVAALVRELDDFGPDQVLVTSAMDWHVDHQMLSLAAERAVRAAAHRPQVLEYPIWSWADGPWSNRAGRGPARAAWDLLAEPVQALLTTRTVSVRTEGFALVKRQALSAYRSQTTRLTGESGWAVMDRRFLERFLGEHEVFLHPAWEAV